jgi:hypothetical protein
LNTSILSTGIGHDCHHHHALSPDRPLELALVAASGYRRWPPRLPEQPIFYPVTNEGYAVEIARDWNVPDSGIGHVTRFDVDAAFMAATRRMWSAHRATPSGRYLPTNWRP